MQWLISRAFSRSVPFQGDVAGAAIAFHLFREGCTGEARRGAPRERPRLSAAACLRYICRGTLHARGPGRQAGTIEKP
jgi:hypothetical protein